MSDLSHPFASDSYAEYRKLKKQFKGRRATPDEWKEIVKTMTQKERDVFFFYRDDNCKVRNDVNPLDCPSKLGISKKAVNGRSRNIKRKMLKFFMRTTVNLK